MKDLSKIDPKYNIIIKGAKLHNLKNIDVVIPRNKFTIFNEKLNTNIKYLKLYESLLI